MTAIVLTHEQRKPSLLRGFHYLPNFALWSALGYELWVSSRLVSVYRISGKPGDGSGHINNDVLDYSSAFDNCGYPIPNSNVNSRPER
ncbi:hypothetical protein SCUP234_04210 [Seiridium cupressi]